MERARQESLNRGAHTRRDDASSSSRGRARKVVVIGAGLAGTTTAYYLAREGFDVTVVEQNGSVASATSRANAGRFCPTSLTAGPTANPAAASAVLGLAWKSVFGGGGGAAKGESGNVPSAVALTPALARWGLHFLRNCTAGRAEANCATMRQLGEMAVRETGKLVEELGMTRESICRSDGTLYLYGDERGLLAGRAKAEAARCAGMLGCVELPLETAIARHPWLAQWRRGDGDGDGQLPIRERVFPVMAADDWSADARLFCGHVGRAAEKLGAKFLLNAAVEGLLISERQGQGERAAGVTLADGSTLPCDALVIATGPWTPSLLQKWLGWRAPYVPIEPMQGCSIDLLGCDGAPDVALADYGSGTLSFQVTPMPGRDASERRVRLCGVAEFVGMDADLERQQRHEEELLARAKEVLPELRWERREATWTGRRPMTPDSLPIVGQIEQLSNVYLNCGHGPVGWTLAAATSWLTCAALVAQNKSFLAPFSVHRFEDDFSLISGVKRSWARWTEPEEGEEGGVLSGLYRFTKKLESGLGGIGKDKPTD